MILKFFDFYTNIKQYSQHMVRVKSFAMNGTVSQRKSERLFLKKGKRNIMDKKEFALFASALKTYFPRENLLPNTQAMHLWYHELCDIDYKIAEIALRKWVATNKWSPTIADIRDAARTVAQGAVPDWGEGWQQVKMAIRKYGMYNIAEAMESLDGITKETVERIGFYELCVSENPEASRANFRMVYEELARRKANDDQIALPLREAILKIQSGNDNKLLEGKANT